MTLIAPLHEPNRRCTHVNEGLSPLSVVITTSIGLWKLHRVGVGFSGGWKLFTLLRSLLAVSNFYTFRNLLSFVPNFYTSIS